jgi:hypothetical protein
MYMLQEFRKYHPLPILFQASLSFMTFVGHLWRALCIFIDSSVPRTEFLHSSNRAEPRPRTLRLLSRGVTFRGPGNSVACSPQANYSDRATAACRRS